MIEFHASAAGPRESFQPDPVAAPILVGVSRAMDRLRGAVGLAAATDAPMLVRGEPGSGKSLVARALHELGPRAGRHCVVIACEASLDGMLDVELFGCVSVDAAGTSVDRRGVLEIADGGTLVLENLEAASAGTLAALARFLATRRVRRVGSVDSGVPVDTRIIATSAKPSQQDGSNGVCASPLWSRFRDAMLVLPALRERTADIPVLCQHFAASVERSERGGVVFSAEAMSALSAYSWPGNVAQLKAVVQRSVAGADEGYVRASDLPVGIRPRGGGGRGRSARDPGVGEELFERMRVSGESFWSSVYPLFMRREITRRDLRDLLSRALKAAHGNDADLLRVLNMKASERRRFEQFLRKYDCAVVRPGAERRS